MLWGGSTRPPAQGRRVSSSPSSSLVLFLQELLYFICLPYRATLCGAACRGVSRVVPGLAPPSPPRFRCGLPPEPRRDIRLRPVHLRACRCRPDHRLPPPRQPTRRRVTAVVECASKRRGRASAAVYAWFASAIWPLLLIRFFRAPSVRHVASPRVITARIEVRFAAERGASQRTHTWRLPHCSFEGGSTRPPAQRAARIVLS